ncbi:glycoside hydrolase family 15 protein [Alkalihalobacillus sp. AL-G]|uniref:glycoside hydrolase family 15 protein n=1 Tax=Alkalihalobacillus sp. AL-G TaxID=2926399 RepID=UPI00272AECBE|nr:glycoside hydrolase family 15 protein [Alkalihalobacillus sp. AL-G]WLD95363.1 glycoside hydrolase family 15 protein [Alkalihalobacillus sp. AL-G]
MNSDKLYRVLEQMHLPNGTYRASLSSHYSYVWIRDVCYIVLPFLDKQDSRYEKAYHALLDMLRNYEWKIDIHRFQKPVYRYEYIHARYSLELKELPVEWGHAQHDAIGLFLWGIGKGIARGKRMLRDEKDREILQKLVEYLDCVRYWEDEDNGMWEEYSELHASSVGACVAGLKAVKMIVDVPSGLIKKGEEALRFLLPRESSTKETDLALLSLIYPFQLVSRKTAREILNRVTSRLERKYGCIRYEGDRYFNEGREAEWCFGFPWLGLCYAQLGEHQQFETYVKKTASIIPENGEVPELYIGGTDQPNENTPLAWAVSMCILFLEVAESNHCMSNTDLLSTSES